MLKRRFVALSLILSLLSVPVAAQNGSGDVLSRIRKEAMERSQIMKTMHMFTDLYGPRLTGSPNHKAAAEWAVKQMTAWGLENAHLEPWDFKHPGWLNERLTAHLISPVKDPLVCEVLAWTPSTKGTIQAKAYQLVLPERPSQEQLNIFLNNHKTKVRGKIVLVGKPAVIPVNLNPSPKRQTDEQAEQRYGPNARPFAFPTPSPTPTPAPNAPKPLSNRQLNEQLDAFLKANGAEVRVNDAGREFRQIRAFNNQTFDVNKTIPTVVMSNEDFGRISRILNDGTEVVLEFNIVNRVYPEGSTSYNTIGEIRGSDKADEVIMLGGHLDSWHAATGATDNAIGCTIMMEAARILKTLGVKPRRTIRVALWSGEEQGLLGSQAYVKEHFGSFEDPKPGNEKFGGYFNIDSGTGRVRGAAVFGPAEAASILREILEPFKADGVAGAVTTRSRRLGGSDNTSFSQAGLPGIGMGQDPIEYGTHTWHTNLDTYERILEDDVKKDAMVVAWAVYQLAMRDDLLPRFSKGDMPPKPAEETTSQPATPAVRTETQTTKPRAKTTRSRGNTPRRRGR
ncbi:MAG TPA: M20/M25/M40 family metallo-hydrolase [Pyrinomonadaceae bacterium]|jgi:Zn-dependent M28 family amino/carboxypeptidase|nr:M20/M25/M40 family metallo-hydrolase [Pyrinomonadaceae bacterium]